MNFPAIEIKNLSFSYNKEFFFKNVNIKISEKSFIGIIGPNGSGKTTFCKLILGLLKPISGEILYFNNSLQNFSAIGYVSQNTNVKDFPLTVKELILLGSVDKKSSFNYFSKNIKRRADNLIQELGLEKIQNFPLTKLSGSQYLPFSPT